MAKNINSFTGVLTALITPMFKGEINFHDLENLIEKQIQSNIQGLVIAGTTGESPTLAQEEHLEVIRFTVEKTRGRIPIIAGTGANCTKEAINLVKKADQLNVDAHLQVVPYYNKPTQQGLFRHFSNIAEHTTKPIILYSIPGRCQIEIEVETIIQLRKKFPHVCALKEAGGQCDKVSEVIKQLGDDMTVLSGDDSLTLPFISVGAKGVVSVLANFLPEPMVDLVQKALNNDFQSARIIHQNLFSLGKQLLQLEPNPVGIKQILFDQNIIQSPEVRLPLTLASLESQALLQKSLKNYFSANY